MEDILYQLFSGEYDITPERDKKQQELRAQIFSELDRVEAAFGTEFLDRLLDLDGERAQQEYYQYYRSGFLTGARLILEVMGRE